jgi:hypothetical protein
MTGQVRSKSEFANRKQPMSNASPRRQRVIEMLQLFASEDQQLAYERDVPHVDMTVELVCMWFDDQYRPKRHFESCFRTEELAALDEFHNFYDHRVGQLPESQGTVRTWLASPVWREVMEQARKTLERLGG